MSRYIELLFFILGITSIVGNNSVKFLSKPYGQLSTSSTLRWVHAENGMVPPNAVIGATRFHHPLGHRNVYICRALHLAEWIPGMLLPENESCIVSLLGNVNSYKVYEVLQNVDNGSRIAWAHWDFYHPPLPGMIAGSSKFYIARKKINDQDDNDVSSQVDGVLKSVKGYTHYVGKFNPEYRFGRISVITEDKEEKDFASGEILVETEPVSYELNDVKFNMARKKIRRERKALAMTILRNTVDTTMEVDSVLEYNFTYTSYWGQGSAILRGLQTIIRNNTGKLLANINWGIEESESRRDVFKVSSVLEPGTAVNITLYGNETRSEFPYSGTLVAFYKDKFRKERNVDGTRFVLDMLDVKPIFGPVYFITNNSLVPTTTTTTTSTTTTTTSVTPVTNTGYTSHEAQSSTVRNNTIVPKSSLQTNDMLSDDGGFTLESKNKEDTNGVFHLDSTQGNGATVRTSLSFIVMFLVLFTSQKIT